MNYYGRLEIPGYIADSAVASIKNAFPQISLRDPLSETEFWVHGPRISARAAFLDSQVTDITLKCFSNKAGNIQCPPALKSGPLSRGD